MPAAALFAGSAVAGIYAANQDASSRSDATDAAMKQKADSQAFIQKQIDQARSDIFKLYPAAQDSRQKALDSGLQLYQQAYPAMMNLFQQGNVGAQKALIQGLPMANNALLGKLPDYNALQPTTIQQPQGLTLPNPQLNPMPNMGQQQIDPQMIAQIQQMLAGGQNA